MSLEKVQLITLVTVPESISLLFMNWQNLVPINPLVISHRGPSVSELINRQLDYAVAAKTQHTWIKIVGWCHVTVQVCPGRSLPGIVCPGVVSFYSLFKESSCRAAHDNSLQEGLWLLCIVSIFWTRELIRWFLTFSAWADPLGNVALVSEASDHWQIRAPGLQAGQTLNFSLCLQILPGELLYAGIKTGSAWRVRFGSLLQNGFPQRPQPSASELNRQRAGLFFTATRSFWNFIFSYLGVWCKRHLGLPLVLLFFFSPGHDRQLLPHERMLQLMKRFGSFRGSKKRKEQCKSSERRQSDPRGLFGRDPLCYPSEKEGH